MLQFVNNLCSSALAYALVHPMCTYNPPRSLLRHEATDVVAFQLSRFPGRESTRAVFMKNPKENHFHGEHKKQPDALKTNNSAH